MAFVRGSSWQWLVVGIGSLMFVGPATAGKIDLLGYMSQLNGTRKMVFKDADATSTCPKNPISMSMSFMTEKGFIGDYDGNAISGKWMQKGKGDRDVKIKFDGDSLDMFNQWIDNRVSVCILSIPDGKPLKFKKVSFKGKINKKGPPGP